MSDKPSIGALVACAIVAVADRGFEHIYKGNAETPAEDIEQKFGVALSWDRIIKSAKLLEDSGVTIVSRESFDNPWISVDSWHFRTIFDRRKKPSAKRNHVALFDRFHTLRSYGEFGSDWLDHVIGSAQKEGRFEIDETLDGGSLNVPASDRIVTLAHNQGLELDSATTELVELVEQENGIDGDTSFRQVVLGQLKAGRELFRSQVFNAQIMHLLLMDMLKRLTEKYEGHVIGASAAALIELLIKHVFGAE